MPQISKISLIAILVLAAQTAFTLPPGITKQIVRLDPSHKLWIYRPAKLKGLRPVVLIAPAGTPLFYGNDLDPGDEPEFTPYAAAGCIVVGYDVSGPYDKATGHLAEAIRAFVNSDSGIKDAQRAINYALKSIPGADPHRIIVAGHSSAATIALEVVEAEPRVRACIAYAPIVDVSARLERIAPKIEERIPGFWAEVQATSPSAHVANIHRPLFLFHADNDTNAPAEPIRALAAKVPHSKLIQVPTGGHYDSMINQGIPAGIRWLRAIGMIK